MPLEQLGEHLEPFIGHSVLAVAVALGVGLLALALRVGVLDSPMAFRDLPFKLKLRLFYAFRAEYFSHERDPPTELIRGTSVSSVERVFAECGYIPRWPLSYHYRGEQANMIRYYYDGEHEFPHRQIHIRLYDEPDGVGVYAHEEPSALHHPEKHIASDDMTTVNTWAVGAYYEVLDGDGAALDPRRLVSW